MTGSPGAFVFVIHDHQPVGNFDATIETTYRRAYLPFLDVLERFPEVRIAFHFSGPLLAWLEREHPEFVARVADLVVAGRVEVLGSAWSEPILTLVPRDLAIRQIERMSREVARLFHEPPRGAWIAERVFDPSLVSVFRDAGIEYVLLDDSHLLRAGVERRALGGPHRIASTDAVIRAFDSDSGLRFTMPYGPVDAAVERIRALLAERSRRIVLVADDGEKFGDWPGSDELVYGRPPAEPGWLPRFFQAMVEEARTVTFRLPGELGAGADVGDGAVPVIEREVAVPAGSYDGFERWSLDPGARAVLAARSPSWEVPFGPPAFGGVAGFLGRYPESRLRLSRASRVWKAIRAMPPCEERERATVALDAAFCNCAYWHGVFGGVYLPHLRRALEAARIEAEKIVDYYHDTLLALDPAGPIDYGSKKRLDHHRARLLASEYASRDLGDLEFKTPVAEILARDRPRRAGEIERVDTGGAFGDALVFGSATLVATVLPDLGGLVQCLDDRRRLVPLADAQARRPEDYHREYAGQATGRAGRTPIVYDAGTGVESLLGLFRDRFLAPGTSIVDLASGRYGEQGDFAAARYGTSEDLEGSFDRHRRSGAPDFELARTGTVFSEDGVPFRVSLCKRYALTGDTLTVVYTLRNEEALGLRVLFAPEFALTAATATEFPSRSIRADQGPPRPLSEAISLEVRARLAIEDRHVPIRVELAISRPATAFVHPIETVTRNFGEFEAIYQGSLVHLAVSLELDPARPAEFRVELAVHDPETSA